jgi:hypothetical protein
MFWYYYLNNKKEKNLLDNYHIKDDNFIVCWQKENRRFTVFENYLDFINFSQQTMLIERCFYEILLPDKTRKIYFDIDLNKGEINEQDLIKVIKKAIFELINPETIILIFTSHTREKYSFHIILPQYHLANEIAAANFYQKTLEKIEEKYHPFIDNSVYKNTQQFRLLGSHKYGKANIKIFNTVLSENFTIPERYVKTEAKYNYLFRLSLISHTNESILLPEYSAKKERNNIEIIGTANEGDVEDILDIFYGHKDFSYDDFVYLNTIENNGNLIITFRRQNATYCSDCKRIHDNENPFLIVKGIERNIYYHCRRKEGQGKLLASLGQYKIPDIDINDVPIINEEKEEEKEEKEDLVNKVFTKIKKRKPEVNLDNLNLTMYY